MARRFTLHQRSQPLPQRSRNIRIRSLEQEVSNRSAHCCGWVQTRYGCHSIVCHTHTAPPSIRPTNSDATSEHGPLRLPSDDMPSLSPLRPARPRCAQANCYAAAAIASLSDQPKHQQPLISAGACQPLVRLVRGDVTVDTQLHASDAIADLSCQNPEARMTDPCVTATCISSPVGICKDPCQSFLLLLVSRPTIRLSASFAPPALCPCCCNCSTRGRQTRLQQRRWPSCCRPLLVRMFPTVRYSGKLRVTAAYHRSSHCSPA